jgi:hypothetical protein
LSACALALVSRNTPGSKATERAACLEPLAEELPRLGLRRRRVHGRRFRRELRPPFEAPVGEGRRHVLPDPLASQILEEPATGDLADLRLVVGDEVLGDAAETTLVIFSCHCMSQSVIST